MGLLSLAPDLSQATRCYGEPTRESGQYLKTTGPIMLVRGTAPQTRESHDSERLSPITKYSLCGTFHVRAKCAESASLSCAEMYGSFSFTNCLAPGLSMWMKPWSSSCTVSPGRP